MPLDRYAKRLLDMLAAGAVADVSVLTPEKIRLAMERLAEAVDTKAPAIGRVVDYVLPGPGGALSARLFEPAGTRGRRTGALVYFHGGAGVFGSIETHQGVCCALANASACRILSVGYRLAPEHPFPAAVEDSIFATQWLFDNAALLDVDSDRIAVGGDSAGGTLAAVVCQNARQVSRPRIALQFFLCPVLDLSRESASRSALGEGYFLERRTLDWALGQYCPSQTDLSDPRLSPLRAKDFRNLPPAHIHTAEFDPLRDEGHAYATALGDAGVEVRYTCHEGMIHHFYAMALAIPYARVALEAAGQALGEALAKAPSGERPAR